MNELNGLMLSTQSKKYMGRDAINLVSAHPCLLQTLLHINKQTRKCKTSKKNLDKDLQRANKTALFLF